MADTKKERRSFLKHKPSEWKREKEKVLKYKKKKLEHVSRIGLFDCRPKKISAKDEFLSD